MEEYRDITRVCNMCGEEKPLSEFGSDRTRKHGKSYRCLPCNRAYGTSRKKNPESDRARQAKYRNRNRELLNAKKREWNHAHRDLINEQRKEQLHTPQAIARRILVDAVRYGTIRKPNRCEECGEVKERREIQAHHPDYSKPLYVQWLCAACHGKITYPHALQEAA